MELAGDGSAAVLATSELNTYHRNPRIGDVDAIAASLQRNKQYRPIVVNRGTLTGRPNEVLAGNHTLLASRQLAWERIACWLIDVDDAEAARIVAADNRTADLGSYDETALIELLQPMDELAGTGYTEADLVRLLRRHASTQAGLTDPDDVASPSRPISEPGDAWVLGPHRLVCGSATDPAAYEQLLAGEKADVIWTDPPYGVSYVGKTKDALTIQNDQVEGLQGLLAAAFPAMVAVAKAGSPVYIAHAEAERVAFETAAEDAGIHVRQVLIWYKNTIVLSHSDYHYRHEPILYGFVRGGKGRRGRGGPAWLGDHSQSSVLVYDKPPRSSEHPTMKPVALVRQMLINSMPSEGIVLDPFAGSGSTLIAAHGLGGRARLLELDPQYADVICRRFQDFTGIKPETASGKVVDFSG